MVHFIIAVHGLHETPGNLTLQNVARVDVAVGQGGPDYPCHEKVFNAPEGVLDSCQVEVRHLRQQWQQKLEQWEQKLKLQQQEGQRLMQHKEDYINATATHKEAALAAAAAERAAALAGFELEKEQLIERATKAEGHRKSDLDKIKKLTRALAREKQAAREAQRAKLRSSGAPALAAAPAQPRTPAAREVRGLGVAVR